MDENIHGSPLIDEEGVREARVLEREKERKGQVWKKDTNFVYRLPNKGEIKINTD